MPSRAADQNLLLGIMAVQNDFVSRDALIEAMNAWVLDKSKSLGEILVERGALSPERHALLTALVAEHIKAHHDDPQQSLAFIPSASALRQQLSQIADADVQASLAAVGAGVGQGAGAGQSAGAGSPDPGAGAGSPDPAPDPEATTPEVRPLPGMRYRILRPHAKGGLGEVFVAEDVELHREVALKEIQPIHAHDAVSRGRFLLEAEVTGRLEHPGIVPVYGLGQYADGRPFYAMRFIHGDNLKEAIRRFHEAEKPGRDPGERRLALRQLLGRFVDVCNAVAYAHSRGVLHRDLKPGNIMLGKYGETLVVDWGLAKAVGSRQKAEGSEEPEEKTFQPSSGSAMAATQMGSAIGTPAYMSPEQAAGQLDKLGPASDIYSLGATLYALLTGQAPFREGDAGDVLQKVRAGEIVPPRRINADIPASLEAICLKAMALDPGNRYPSCAKLAEDIEHWLADEPVTAYREPLPARTRRWARRHKPLVAGMAALVLTALLLGGGWIWWYQREQTTREAARLARQADTERDVTTALVEADTYLKEGWKQTDYPERWQATVVLALSAVQRAEGLLAAGEPTEELSEHVQAMRLAVDEAARDSRLRAELVRIRLDMTGMRDGRYDFARGAARYAAALRAYGLDETQLEEAAKVVRSSRLREVLIASVEDWAGITPEPTERQRLDELLRRVEPEPDAFRSRWRAAWNRRDRAALCTLAREELVRQLPAAVLVNLAMDLKNAGELAAAERLLRAGQERYPSDFWLNHDLGMVLGDLKPPHEEEAMRFLTAALALRSNSAGVNLNLGSALYAKKDLEGAIRCFRTAIDLDPKHALAHANLGDALKAKGDLEGAIRYYRNAIEIDPKYAAAHNNLGLALHDKENFEGAIRCFRNAIEIDPKYAKAHNNLGLALADKKDLEGAIRCFRNAIEIDPKLAGAHNNLGTALADKKDLEGAIRCFRNAIEIDPKIPQVHVNLGQALLAHGRFAEAREATQEALQLLKPGDSLHAFVSGQLRACETLLALDAKLPAVLKGEAKPADVDEQIGLAKLCQEHKKLYTAAARFYGDAFAAEPKRADDLQTSNRYNAACSAALAGCGQGEDAAKQDDKERTHLRQQALTWLRDDLAAWSKLLDQQPDKVRPAVQQTMQHWQQDADFTSVRGDALAKLPEAEREGWRKLWEDVEALRRRAAAPR